MFLSNSPRIPLVLVPAPAPALATRPNISESHSDMSARAFPCGIRREGACAAVFVNPQNTAQKTTQASAFPRAEEGVLYQDAWRQPRLGERVDEAARAVAICGARGEVPLQLELSRRDLKNVHPSTTPAFVVFLALGDGGGGHSELNL